MSSLKLIIRGTINYERAFSIIGNAFFVGMTPEIQAQIYANLRYDWERVMGVKPGMCEAEKAETIKNTGDSYAEYMQRVRSQKLGPCDMPGQEPKLPVVISRIATESVSNVVTLPVRRVSVAT